MKRSHFLLLLLLFSCIAVSVTHAAKRTRKAAVKRVQKPRGIGKIVYVHPLTDIWVMNADGTNKTLILEAVNAGDRPSYLHSSPRFSLDGQKIVFDTSQFGDREICTMNADGTGLKRLTTNKFIDQEAAFSPNGKQIVYSSRRVGIDDDFEIMVMNADGSAQKAITQNDGGDSDPSWSPDGKKIIFTSEFTGPGDYNPHSEICVMNADGTGLKRFSKKEQLGTSPCFSLDGTKIAFAGGEIYVMNADGSGVKGVTKSEFGHGAGAPSFSPDGKKIAFSSSRYQPDHATPDRDAVLNIFTINLDGTQQKPLTFGGDGDYHSEPSWAPGWVPPPRKPARK